MWLVFIAFTDISFGIDGGSPKALHSSCLDLKDGQHYLQILTDEEFRSVHPSHDPSLAAPIVHAKCDFGYTIIDPSFDSDWEKYFSSIHKWQVNTIGPDLDDHASWNEWFLPSQVTPPNTMRSLLRDHDAHENHMDLVFSISPDCQKCIGAHDDKYRGKAYYLSADTFGCSWPTTGLSAHNILSCQIDDTGFSDCEKCDVLTKGAKQRLYYEGKCGSMIFDANSPTLNSQLRGGEKAVESNKLPSLGMYVCVCVCGLLFCV